MSLSNLDGRVGILLFDIETLPIQGLSFSRWQTNITPKWSTADSSVICIAYRWLHGGSTKCIHIGEEPDRYRDNPYDDQGVIMEFDEVMKQADFVVAHNGNGFDVPILAGRRLVHGLDPVNVNSLDTLPMVRGCGRMPRGNGLSAVADSLGVAQKIVSENGWWFDIATKSCTKSLKKMVHYCKRDVDVLHDVFNIVYPRTNKILPHMGRYLGNSGTCCDRCGSEDYKPAGKKMKNVHAYHLYTCTQCSRTFEGAKVKMIDK